MAAAKLPLIKEVADFDFSGTPINEGLERDAFRPNREGFPNRI